MTKRDKNDIDTFLKRLFKHKRRRLVSAKVFDKRSKPGKQLVVIPIGTIINEWKTCKKNLEK